MEMSQQNTLYKFYILIKTLQKKICVNISRVIKNSISQPRRKDVLFTHSRILICSAVSLSLVLQTPLHPQWSCGALLPSKVVYFPFKANFSREGHSGLYFAQGIDLQ
jgi:hypothetical protein